MIYFMLITDVAGELVLNYSISRTENVMYFMHVNKGMTCSCSTENGNWNSEHPLYSKIGSQNIL